MEQEDRSDAGHGNDGFAGIGVAEGLRRLHRMADYAHAAYTIMNDASMAASLVLAMQRMASQKTAERI